MCSFRWMQLRLGFELRGVHSDPSPNGFSIAKNHVIVFIDNSWG
jgi:hypothetical protein